MKLVYLIFLITSSSLLWLSSGVADQYDVKSSEHFRLISESFSDSLDVVFQTDHAFLEFCPDNTCDLVVFEKDSPESSLLDFGFIYIYYFSDYYILEKWREKDESKLLASQVLESKVYASCRNPSETEWARCILHLLGEQYQVKIYAVRYDEGERVLDNKLFP